MKKTVIVLVSVLLSFIFLFVTFVGYAAFTDNLTVQVEMDVGVQDGVFIIGTSVPEGTNASVAGYTASIMNSTVTLGASGGSKARIEVTVHNGTIESYGYNALLYSPETGFDNPAFLVNVYNMDGTELERKTEVKAGESFTFYAEFTYADGAVPDNKTLNSVLNFDFLPIVDFPIEKDETTVSGAMARLEQILESPTDSATLQKAMENTNIWGGRWNSSYISNVSGAPSDDKNSIAELFAGNLTAVIDGKEVEVKVLIKNEDGGGIGDEMVIYMTTDTLKLTAASNGRYTSRPAVVYRCVFDKTTKEDGTVDWVQQTMVTGTAPVSNYAGQRSNNSRTAYEGSFNTDYWTAS